MTTPSPEHPWRQPYKQRRLAPKREVFCASCGSKLERQGFNGKPYRCMDCKNVEKRQRAKDWYARKHGKMA